MNNTKETLVSAFALFSLFFGAGNLILPPFIGFNAGDWWWLMAIGFCLSAILIPILGIFAHAKLQGTIFDFGKKVSTSFGLIYSLLIYAIAVALPSPRTASVTHEIGIAPFFDIPPIYTSIIYFGLVLVFALNRSKILNILGKFLTPAILLILLAIIGISIFSFDFNFGVSTISNPFTDGILEGYQTFDAIAAVVVGGVLIISINIKNKDISYTDRKALIRNAGIFAGVGLLFVYGGLILTGALMHGNFETGINRTDLLNGISRTLLGNEGNKFLSILVSLACFTTAIGIVTGTADFIKDRFNNSNKAYTITAIISCLLGIAMGQFNVDHIIVVAIPALMFIYPITIILIVLNVLPDKYTEPKVFRAVVFTTILFSVPDFLNSIGITSVANFTAAYLPLSKYSLAWVLPAVIALIVGNLTHKKTTTV
ncbi:LIVCS family branched-chain amino acid:cation transporter [Cellulophaga sp. RHA19]|uniref:branched-chain amino acid transport system II carrier protein n=1 Tax=Cellulophaga sp. RHA19 TaxID=1798237 RepID=UPI000C2B8CA4|nr:branched-chain amino acid transport system II carrier protein [Cellulophaga sp. RHA19]PKB42480.1 LIVCS family branched-chain amino acid:cation transporter [Cellulophaga sp. RHA19]